MYPLTFAEAARVLGKQCSDQTIIEKVIIDSRQAAAGSLFFALPGTKTDGHHFVGDVLEAGGFAVVKRGWGRHQRVIEVDDPLLALQELAKAHLAKIGVPVVAVTGSNGKTTTKDFTAAVLGAKYNVWKTQGSYNNEIGLPLTILSIEPMHEVLVLEMGMRGLGEIKRLTEIAPPQVAVITNVYPVHLERLGSMDRIAEAKAEILMGLKPDGTAVLNGDDAYVRRHAAKAKHVLFYGKGVNNQLRAENITVDSLGRVGYDLRWNDQVYRVQLAVPGVHNVYNSLAAVGVGIQFGIPISIAIEALPAAEFSGMRLEIEHSSDGMMIINDAYNASPASMEAALATMVQIAGQRRKVAILGDMYELGPISDSAHEQVGVWAAQAGDLLVFVGKNAHLMSKGAQSAGFSPSNIRIYSTVEQLLSELNQLVSKEDLVLVKASRAAALEQVVAALKAR